MLIKITQLLIILVAAMAAYVFPAETDYVTAQEDSTQTSLSALSFAEINLSDCTVSLAYNEFVADGKYHMPKVTVTYKGKKLNKKEDYTVTYYGGKAEGISTVKVTGQGNCRGEVTLQYTGKANPASSTAKPTKTTTKPAPSTTKQIKPAPRPTASAAKTNAAKPPAAKKSHSIGQARADLDRKPGDSSGREVVESKFLYSSSRTSVYNWTYVFRPKDAAKGSKAAAMCEKAVKNNKIGYCGSGKKKYGKKSLDKLAPKVGYDLSKITTKTGCSCGDLICICNRYAGLSTCYIGSGVQLARSYKNNGNFTCYAYKKGMTLKRGDVLITAHKSGKNNHVVMCL